MFSEKIYTFICYFLNLFPNRVYNISDLRVDAVYLRHYPCMPQRFVFKGITEDGEIKVIYFDKGYGEHVFVPEGFFAGEDKFATRLYVGG